MSTSSVMVDYDPRWPILYEQEKARILQALGKIVVAVEHIGSTAVPGLAAKPTVDIMAAVRVYAESDRCIGPLRLSVMSIRP